MKRVIFIILWMAIFFVVTVCAWYFAWGWTGLAAVAAQDFVDQLELIAAATRIAMPLLGLLLGLFGKLPGTHPPGPTHNRSAY